MTALCEDNGEDSVGTAAGLIHVGGSHGPGWGREWSVGPAPHLPNPGSHTPPPHQPASPRLIATVHEVSNVSVGGHSQFRQVLHVGAQDGVLSDPQRAPTLGVQEVSYPLAVDLHVAHLSGRNKPNTTKLTTIPSVKLPVDSH